MATTPDEHVRVNRAYWDDMADQWVAPGQRRWASPEPVWGIWDVPDDQVSLLPPDCSGLDVVELGCGTGYVSGWAARRGARSVTGIDNSAEQLATARRLADEHGVEMRLDHGDAEQLPYDDASFDHAVSEYGAATWCRPEAWLAEAHRVLRPGGTLAFLTNHPLVGCASPVDGRLPVERELVTPWFGRRRLDWRDAADDPGGMEFLYGTADWFAVLRAVGLVVDDYREPVPTADGGDDEQRFAVTRGWARRWPSEQVWWVRRPA